MDSGPSPPNADGNHVLPSIEIIDLTGLSSSDESSDEWVDISNVIDLTNLTSEDEDDAPARVARVNHIAAKHQHHRVVFRRDVCELCNRVARYDRGITKHHLYPQSVVKAAPAGTYTEHQRNTLALLCWPCHSAIHRIMSNDTLAAAFHSVQLLKSHKEVQDWIRRMQRATTAELDASHRRPRVLGISGRNSKRKTRLIQRPESLKRPLPSQRPEEDTSRFGGAPRRSARLADLGTGASSTIARVGASNTGQASGVVKTSKMTKKERNRANRLARSMEKADKIPGINKALDTIWRTNGNGFPTYYPGDDGKNFRLRDEVKRLGKHANLRWSEVRSVMRTRPEYRKWYEWSYTPRPQADRQPSLRPLQDQNADEAQIPDLQGGDGGTEAMEGVQIQSDGLKDRDAPESSVREPYYALEKAGDYIPL
ncbi:hypothetical protein VPNG_08272 [Cytospora leucostoma]|uniref:HNH domain-containing protein n=1 Tax=Cytospora leucostoma TaxID=1230097 RepID=A0A423WC14_9PEZI|nr:hypothetical protein VPNG_08272 [Cytospora leucostoma]